MNKPVVLDASAVLALLHKEPGSEVVSEYIEFGASMSSVNFAEVISKQQEIQIPSEETVNSIRIIGIQIHHFDHEAAVQVGVLRNLTKALGLSLGDRACIALGQRLQYPILTADRTWSQLQVGVEIIQIR